MKNPSRQRVEQVIHIVRQMVGTWQTIPSDCFEDTEALLQTSVSHNAIQAIARAIAIMDERDPPETIGDTIRSLGITNLQCVGQDIIIRPPDTYEIIAFICSCPDSQRVMTAQEIAAQLESVLRLIPKTTYH